MPEYINKQELLEKAKSIQGKLWGDVLIVNAIENADGVDIVFCKECKHYTQKGISGVCKVYSTNQVEGIVLKDHFCSYGERREK